MAKVTAGNMKTGQEAQKIEYRKGVIIYTHAQIFIDHMNTRSDAQAFEVCISVTCHPEFRMTGLKCVLLLLSLQITLDERLGSMI